MLVSAGSGVANLGNSSSAGVPDGFVSHTISLPFNDHEVIKRLFELNGNDIAAIIIEPVPANMGVILPQNKFLQLLRNLTDKYNSLLIFDEVITGFRLSLGGAQHLFGITPDLTTIGKIIGGGFPAAAFGGRADIMSLLAPDGPVYQAGTLSGNPVAMSAGTATLELLSSDGFYEELNKKADRFIQKLKDVASDKGILINQIGSMFTLFFSDRELNSFEDVKKTDQRRFARFFRYMLNEHFYISPSQFEANFISIAHTEKELDRFIKSVKKFQ
jgi:glutamate-1-semialdehyde 2,1-aminomutase